MLSIMPPTTLGELQQRAISIEEDLDQVDHLQGQDNSAKDALHHVGGSKQKWGTNYYIQILVTVLLNLVLLVDFYAFSNL